MNLCNDQVKNKSAYCSPQYIKEVKDRLNLLPDPKNIMDVKRELLARRYANKHS